MIAIAPPTATTASCTIRRRGRSHPESRKPIGQRLGPDGEVLLVAIRFHGQRMHQTGARQTLTHFARSLQHEIERDAVLPPTGA
jgi:hypothetical protein